MGWRTIAAVLVLIFSVAVIQSLLAGPLVTLQNDINATGDYSNEHFDGNALITGFLDSWFDMGLVAIFGGMAWAAVWVVRRELTRGGL